MFLDYLALGLLLLIITGVFYVFMYIHDIPYEIAEKRHHPQKDAIYWGCWLSLFTLHVLWPFIFLWAVSRTPKVEVTSDGSPANRHPEGHPDPTSVDSARESAEGSEIKQLREQIVALHSRLAAIELQHGDQVGASHD